MSVAVDRDQEFLAAVRRIAEEVAGPNAAVDDQIRQTIATQHSRLYRAAAWVVIVAITSSAS